MYRVTIREGPGYKFVTKSYGYRSGAPGSPRREKRKRTPEEIEKQNKKNRARNVQLLILGNFQEGWHITLTYQKDKRPSSAEDAKKELAKFHRRMKTKFQKAGFEYKWIAVTEIGSHGGIHHHLILEDIHTETFTTRKAVQESWQFGTYFTPLYEDGEYEQLSDYLTKKESKEEVPGCKVSHSRNLIMPKVKKKLLFRKKWKEEPKVPKGWRLAFLENTISEYTGYPSQNYLLLENKPPGG